MKEKCTKYLQSFVTIIMISIPICYVTEQMYKENLEGILHTVPRHKICKKPYPCTKQKTKSFTRFGCHLLNLHIFAYQKRRSKSQEK